MAETKTCPATPLLLFLLRAIDTILLIFFITIAIVAPLFDAQSCLPPWFYTKFLRDLNSWYGNQLNDYLTVEKPNFFVGLVWAEILFQWPLSIANVYGLLARKEWFPTTCLIFGSSISTAMAAILGELILSGKASEKLLMVYLPFLVLPLLAIFRALIPNSKNKVAPISAREKKA